MNDRLSLVRELAHELRDALSPIRSAIDLLRLRNFDADVSRHTAETVDRGLDCALAAVDAFVIADQCESGTLSIIAAPTSLDQIIESARTALAPLLMGRSQRCEFAPSHPGIEVMADAAKSLQVITAMLEQASAVAPPRSAIEVQAAAADSGPEIRVRFFIDTPTVVGEDWFESYRRRPRGSRMALRTARRVMALQHGSLQLTLHSPGAGELVATFAPADAARLPARSSSARGVRASAAAPAIPVPRPSRTRILIVEDSKEVRVIYREALVALGYSVTEAVDAEEALRATADAAPDVALIDIHLPGMNGYRLAQALKARARSSMRLVMLSGMTLDDTTLSLSRNAGFDDCIDKAAGPKALHALLQAPAASEGPAAIRR
ncbi:MAG TPA: response regulator [Steroidobacteraceae bacterium]